MSRNDESPFLFYRRIYPQGQYGYTTVMVVTPDGVGASPVMTGLTKKRAVAVANAVTDELFRFVMLNGLDTPKGLTAAKKARQYKFHSYSVGRGGDRVWNVLRRMGDRGGVDNVIAFTTEKEAKRFINVLSGELYSFRQDNGLLLPGESSGLTDAHRAAILAAKKAAGRSAPSKANGAGKASRARK